MEASKVATYKRRTAASRPEVPSSKDRDELIARRAYELWQARGCPSGDDLRDWLEAERQIAGEAMSEPRR